MKKEVFINNEVRENSFTLQETTESSRLLNRAFGLKRRKLEAEKQVNKPSLCFGESNELRICKVLPALKRFTDVDNYFPQEEVGEGHFTNTESIKLQISSALAMSTHPLIQEIMEDNSISAEKIPVDEMMEKRVLAGIKILDMGCSPEPVFARVAHALGADVYTLDLHELPRERDEELLHNHTAFDMNDKRVVDILKESTGGNFDLVTAVMVLDSPWNRDGVKEPSQGRLQEIGVELLKESGFYVGDMGTFLQKTPHQE